MAHEYSYFRAEGLSLEALETVKESQAELVSLKTKLCAKFGANQIMGGYRKDMGHFHVVAFHFRPGQKVPDGWQLTREQRGADGALQYTFALPAPNSPDAFHVASLCGLMERASRHDSLERVFGVERFMRDHPAGEFETAFVRQGYLADATLAKGKIRGPAVLGAGATPPGKTADPIYTMDLAGSTYIRVPNRPGTDDPVVTPPDAVRMSYDQMLKADKAEQDIRNQPREYGVYGC